ncbi:MAG TPA: hypothetical protein VGJ13_19920 [Pseudonocardiaceae bacterium]
MSEATIRPRVVALPLPADATKEERLRRRAFKSWVQKVPCPVPHCRAQPFEACKEPSHGGFRRMITWHPQRQDLADKRLGENVRDETGVAS